MAHKPEDLVEVFLSILAEAGVLITYDAIVVLSPKDRQPPPIVASTVPASGVREIFRQAEEMADYVSRTLVNWRPKQES